MEKMTKGELIAIIEFSGISLKAISSICKINYNTLRAKMSDKGKNKMTDSDIASIVRALGVIVDNVKIMLHGKDSIRY